jgi:uncharacterized iron-regulated membrane protein
MVRRHRAMQDGGVAKRWIGMSFERFLKSVHSWLGVMILPWVVAAGFTGLYMNHDDLILSLFPVSAHYDTALIDASPLARAVDEDDAARIAALVAPGVVLRLTSQDSFRDRFVFTFDAGTHDVIVDEDTGFVWTDSRYATRTYQPDGTWLHTRIRWGRVLSSIHERGWVGTGLGTWLADIAAGALVVFGLSGLVLFAAPRARRAKNRRVKAAMVKASAKA